MVDSRVPADMKRGRLDEAEKAQIVKLAEGGWVPGRIAQRLNRHPGTINYAMIRLGLRAAVPKTFSYVRNGVEVKSFSPEEDAYIEALRVQDLTNARIAELVTARFGHRRSGHTINIRLVMLASQEAA